MKVTRWSQPLVTLVSRAPGIQVYVLKRPHVDEFLKRMGELFECVLFTASLAKVGADCLLPWIPLWTITCTQQTHSGRVNVHNAVDQVHMYTNDGVITFVYIEWLVYWFILVIGFIGPLLVPIRWSGKIDLLPLGEGLKKQPHPHL